MLLQSSGFVNIGYTVGKVQPIIAENVHACLNKGFNPSDIAHCDPFLSGFCHNFIKVFPDILVMPALRYVRNNRHHSLIVLYWPMSIAS